MTATNFIKEAFSIFSPNMKTSILNTIDSFSPTLCASCSENLKRMESHLDYKTKKPFELIVDYNDDFEFNLDGFELISEHTGMPAVTSHHTCPDCFSNYHYYCDSTSGRVFNFSSTKLNSIVEFESFFENQITIQKKNFASFLNDYVKNKNEILTFYAVMDENFKRSNHNYLIEYYTKQKYDLNKLNFLSLFLSENELFSSGRSGGLFKNSFLQRFAYPVNSLQIEYSDYFEEIQINFDVREIIKESNSFFDIYKNEFVTFNELDLKNIHMVKRCKETYDFLSLFKEKYNSFEKETPNEIDNLFSEWFSSFSTEFLSSKFKDEYSNLLNEREKDKQELLDLLESPIEFDRFSFFKPKTKPDSLKDFSDLDTVIVNNSIFKDKKACIRYLDYDKEKITVVFFDDFYGENEIALNPSDCIKI